MYVIKIDTYCYQLPLPVGLIWLSFTMQPRFQGFNAENSEEAAEMENRFYFSEKLGFSEILGFSEKLGFSEYSALKT